MRPKTETALYRCAAAWVLAGTAWYCYAFARDFYAANRHAVHALLDRAGF